jgi:hypothetical protein
MGKKNMDEDLTPFEYLIYRETIIKTVILFVYHQLSFWRDNPYRTQETSEVELTSDLVTYLSKTAHNEEHNFLFNHEEPQPNRYRIDFAAFPAGEEDDYTKKITVFECKRLPAPSPSRTNEYIAGKLGGIQRFKLEKHGANHEIVGMVGYIQSSTIKDHLDKINTCITDFCLETNDGVLKWKDDKILTIMESNISMGVCHSLSIHQRVELSPITIHHLWVVL